MTAAMKTLTLAAAIALASCAPSPEFIAEHPCYFVGEEAMEWLMDDIAETVQQADEPKHSGLPASLYVTIRSRNLAEVYGVSEEVAEDCVESLLSE